MTLTDYLYIVGSLVVSLGGGATIVVSLSSWLGKMWADRFLEKEKAELQRLGFEHQTRFAQLHEKRALLIAELYRNLRQLDDGVKMVRLQLGMTPLDSPEIARKSLDLTCKYIAAREHFEQNQIFFRADICETLRKIIELSSNVSDEYFDSLLNKKEDALKIAVKSACETVDELAKDIQTALQAVERYFREELGVIDRK